MGLFFSDRNVHLDSGERWPSSSCILRPDAFCADIEQVGGELAEFLVTILPFFASLMIGDIGGGILIRWSLSASWFRNGLADHPGHAAMGGQNGISDTGYPLVAGRFFPVPA